MANSSLKFSSDGIEKLQKMEGTIDGIYNDQSGYCTFGTGHLVHSKTENKSEPETWGCFLLETASAEKDWKTYILKKNWGGGKITKYLGSSIATPAFDEKFNELKEKTTENAKLKIAKDKYKKAYSKLSKEQRESIDSIAKDAVDEEARLLTKSAKDILNEDILDKEQAVRNGITIELTQGEYDALVSLTYNIGIKNFNSSPIVKEINKNKHRTGEEKDRKTAIEAIEKAFLFHNKSNGTVLDDLTKRRKEEAAQFLHLAKKDLLIQEVKSALSPLSQLPSLSIR